MDRSRLIGIARAASPWLLSLLAGFLLAAPTLSVYLFWTHWFALVPWAVMFSRDEQAPKLRVYIAGLYLYGLIAHRITASYGLVAFVALLTLHQPLFWLYYFVIKRLGRMGRIPLVVSVPVAWVAVEYLRQRFVMGGMEMQLLAYSHVPFRRLIQIADITGCLGISLVIATLNGALAQLVVSLHGWPRPTLAARRRVVASFALAGGLVLATMVYGAWALRRPLEPGPRVSILQAELRHRKVEAEAVMLGELAKSRQWFEPGSTDLVIWPEYSVLDYLDSDLPFREDLVWLAHELKADVLVGAYGHAPGDRAAIANTAVLIDQAGVQEGRYDKLVLIAGTEYVPGATLLGLIQRDLPKYARRFTQKSGFSGLGAPAAEPRTITWQHGGKAIVLGTPLCQEGMVEWVNRALVRRGAQILINPTSEGDAGFNVQRTILAMAQLRAVENRVPFVRAGNDGISCVIDSTGRVVEVLRGRHTGRLVMEEGSLTTKVPLDPHSGSFYTRTGPVIGYLSLALCLPVVVPRRMRVAWVKPAATGLVIALAAAAGAAAVLGARNGTPALEPELRRAAAAVATHEGKQYFEAKADLDALRRLRAAVASDPDADEAVTYLAEVCRRNQWHDEGYRVLSEAYAAGGRSTALLEALAFFENVSDRRGAALAHVDEAITQDPDRQSARLLRAEIMATGGDRDGAMHSLEAWLAVKPDSRSATRRLAEFEILAGRTSDAEARLRRSLAGEPRDVEALKLLGRALVASDRSEEAASVLAQAIALDGHDTMAQYLLGRAQLRLGLYKEAEALASRMLAVTPGMGTRTRQPPSPSRSAAERREGRST